jgi:hypothetical protein
MMTELNQKDMEVRGTESDLIDAPNLSSVDCQTDKLLSTYDLHKWYEERVGQYGDGLHPSDGIWQPMGHLT